jgi:hypothetical protein
MYQRSQPTVEIKLLLFLRPLKAYEGGIAPRILNIEDTEVLS